MEKKITISKIDALCWEKFISLLKETFGDTAATAVYERPETLSERFTLSLPEEVADTYRLFLSDLWEKHAPQGAPAFGTIMNAKKIMKLARARYAEDLEVAHAEALKVSTWEKLTSTNHKDVTLYVGLLKDCTEEILKSLMNDFLIDAEKYFPEEG